MKIKETTDDRIIKDPAKECNSTFYLVSLASFYWSYNWFF